MLRRIFIFLILIMLLVGFYQLREISEDWHYVVPSEPGKLLYASTFDDTDNWEQRDEQNARQIRDGMMVLTVQENDTQIYSASAHYYDDFDLTVFVEALDGDLDNGYGVVFRQKNRDNYYTFLISSDGYYRIMRRVDNVPKVLSNWHPSDIIQQGFDVVNQLRVIGYEDRLQFFINGQQMQLCIPDNPDGESTPNNVTGECIGGQWLDTLIDDTIGFGRIGVTVAVDNQPTGPVIAFDNVTVYGSEPIK